MQLPRGTFHSMKKGMKIAAILKSLKEEAFSGSCSIACEGCLIDLVLQDGGIVLASCNADCGKDAMDRLTALHEEVADASLSDLTLAQMKLTLEFNAQCRVTEKREINRKVTSPPREEGQGKVHRNFPEIVPEKPVIEDMQVERKTSPAHAHRTPAGITTPSPVAPGGKKYADPLAREGDELTMVDRDLKALDSMDLDTMSEKIRENCKLMIEKLHLEHLMEKQGD